jgi:hypothetical protein
MASTAAALAVWGACPARAGTEKAGGKELSPAQTRAVKQVEGLLKTLKAPGAHVEAITDKALNSAFPAYTFVVVRFRMWPVAVQPPKELKSQNLFAISKPDSMHQLSSPRDLERFFHEQLKGKDEARARTALLAYLRLAQELVQDGFYTFQPPSVEKSGVDPDDRIVEGDVQVKPERGNKGFLRAKLIFDKETGNLKKAVQENKVARGIRPRCQATRLLDPDPLIRAICEQDILVMGIAARAYLMEQRARATPELRRAIDRIWQRILDEDR